MIKKSYIEHLKKLDTPTVCNALEVVDPSRRGYGFTTANLNCIRPDLPPIVGHACTAIYRGVRPGPRSINEQKKFEGKYFDYVSSMKGPRIVVFQDGDGLRARSAAIFGEVMSAMHSALGCEGLITDGAVRDMDMMVDGFQCLHASVAPSHIWFHMAEFACEVNVCGMVVNSGDIIHADVHGAVILQEKDIEEIISVSRDIASREDRIISLCKSDHFSVERLKKIWGGQ